MYVVRANGRYRSNKLLNFLSFGDSFFSLATWRCRDKVFAHFSPIRSLLRCHRRFVDKNMSAFFSVYCHRKAAAMLLHYVFPTV